MSVLDNINRVKLLSLNETSAETVYIQNTTNYVDTVRKDLCKYVQHESSVFPVFEVGIYRTCVILE